MRLYCAGSSFNPNLLFFPLNECHASTDEIINNNGTAFYLFFFPFASKKCLLSFTVYFKEKRSVLGFKYPRGYFSPICIYSYTCSVLILSAHGWISEPCLPTGIWNKDMYVHRCFAQRSTALLDQCVYYLHGTRIAVCMDIVCTRKGGILYRKSDQSTTTALSDLRGYGWQMLHLELAK